MRHPDAIEIIEVSEHVKAYVYHDQDAEEPYQEPAGICEPYGSQRDYFPKHLETKTRQYHPGRGLMAEEYALTGRSTGNGGSNDLEEPDYLALARHVTRNYGSPLYILCADTDRYSGSKYYVSTPEDADSRYVMGYAFLTPEQRTEEGASFDFGAWLKAVLEEHTSWANGDVYGYVVEIDGDEDFGTNRMGDSCWGFYGLEYAISEARRAAESYVGYAEMKAAASFEGVA